MKKRIVFITDCVDVAFNELRAVVLSELKRPEEVEIEPLAPVKPFSVVNGNFVLRLMAELYPAGTIFSVILNPSKNRPARLIGRTNIKGFLFMSANTGVLDWFLRDFGVEELYELHDPGFVAFGGKHVHAPAIAKIAEGGILNEMGHVFKVADVARLDLAEGTIVHIDNFGLMKLFGASLEAHEGDAFEISVAGRKLRAVYAKRMMSREDGDWVIYPGSSLGLLEIGKVRSDGAKEINAKEGDVAKISRI